MPKGEELLATKNLAVKAKGINKLAFKDKILKDVAWNLVLHVSMQMMVR